MRENKSKRVYNLSGIFNLHITQMFAGGHDDTVTKNVQVGSATSVLGGK